MEGRGEERGRKKSREDERRWKYDRRGMGKVEETRRKENGEDEREEKEGKTRIRDVTK